MLWFAHLEKGVTGSTAFLAFYYSTAIHKPLGSEDGTKLGVAIQPVASETQAMQKERKTPPN
jgi:hypothetical protein